MSTPFYNWVKETISRAYLSNPKLSPQLIDYEVEALIGSILPEKFPVSRKLKLNEIEQITILVLARANAIASGKAKDFKLKEHLCGTH